MKKPPAKRTRNAAATREAILKSARAAFARAGYDGVGVREIAASAGVTAMMVNRYFGSKEKLFAEVSVDTMANPFILTDEVLGSKNPGERMAEILVELTRTDATPLDGFLVMVHSASSKRAAEIGREQIEKHHLKTLTAALSGPDAAQRAAVMLAMVAGFQAMRQMIGLSTLAKSKPQTLVKLLAPLFQKLIDGR